MGTVTVTGRDELGRIIDVTLTTTADVPPPGPEVVAVGEAGASGLPDPAGQPDGLAVVTVDEAYVLEAPSVGEIQVVTRTLTSAEILDLFTSPVTLVAGEAGKVFWAIGGMLVYNFGTIGYEPGPSGGDFVVGTFEAMDWLGAFFLSVGESPSDIVIPMFPLTGTGAVAAQLGGPLQIWVLISDPINGDGTIDVTVAYRVVDVS